MLDLPQVPLTEGTDVQVSPSRYRLLHNPHWGSPSTNILTFDLPFLFGDVRHGGQHVLAKSAGIDPKILKYLRAAAVRNLQQPQEKVLGLDGGAPEVDDFA